MKNKVIVVVVLTIVLILGVIGTEFVLRTYYHSSILGSGQREISHGRTVILNPVVYVAGGYGTGEFEKDTACYWKNNIQIDLLPAGARTSAIYVLGNNVFVAGHYKKGNSTTACYWKNGIKTDLSTDEGYTSSIFAKENDVFIAGHYPKGDIARGCYWKNGVKVDLSNDSTESTFTRSIYVSGEDVFVAGFYRSTSNDKLVIRACYWKNGIRTICGDSSDAYSIATSITVDGNNVYIAGEALTRKDEEIGCYWINGKNKTNVIVLPSPLAKKRVRIFTIYEQARPIFLDERYNLIQSMVLIGSIAVQDSTVYIAGECNIKGKTVACFWKNGMLIELPGTTKSTTATSMVINGAEIYIVGDDGGACYWKNGVKVQLSGKAQKSFRSIGISIGQE